MLNNELRNDESLDDLILGNMKVIQPREGYRFSLDAVLLAHFPAGDRFKRIVELGSGSGIISLLMAWRAPLARITALEVQSAMVERSRRSVVLNGLQERIDIIEADINETEMDCNPAINPADNDNCRKSSWPRGFTYRYY